MKKLLAIAALLACTAPTADAADRIPQQFVGPWCADAKTPQLQPSSYELNPSGTVYRRAQKCNAHEPEEILIIHPDRMLISDIADCKFLETTSVTRHGTHRLKFWCKSPYETWIFDAWFSVPGRNQIVVEMIEEKKTGE